MTKLLNARDLLDMLRAEEPDPEERSDHTRGRKRYEGASGVELRVFPRREKVDHRLPMVEIAGPPSPPEPPKPPEPPRMPRPQKVYDLSAPEPPRPPIPPTPPVPRVRAPGDVGSGVGSVTRLGSRLAADHDRAGRAGVAHHPA